MPYTIMSIGPPWVTPSFLCKKWPGPSSMSHTTRVSHWWYQLKVNCAPLGHSCRTSQSIAVRFASLNALHASMRRNPQSSSCEFLCHISLMACIPPSIPVSTPPFICSVPQVALASCPVTQGSHFAINRRQVPLDPDRSDPWMLVQCDQPAAHHGAVSGPWGTPIDQPIRKVRNNQPQFPDPCPKT